MTVTSRARFRSALPWLPLLAIPALIHGAQAQTIVSSPAAPGGSAAAIPASPLRAGVPVIIAAAVDTSGNADNAKLALAAANSALKSTPGYAPMPASGYAPLSAGQAAASIKNLDFSYPFTASDFVAMGKATKATSALTVSVTPLADGAFSAVAEMIRTSDGAIIGYGKGNGAAAIAGEAVLEGTPTPLDSAVAAAVMALGETARIPGIVISKPAPNLARLSLGTQSGARAGARIEYVGENDQTLAVGTIIDISAGEALATVAPETAFPGLYVNQRIRLVANPTLKRAMPTLVERQDKDYKEFERHFAVSYAIAGAVYLFGVVGNK